MKVYLWSDYQDHWPEGPTAGSPAMPKAEIIGLVLAENKNQAIRLLEEKLGPEKPIKADSVIRVTAKEPYVYIWKIK